MSHEGFPLPDKLAPQDKPSLTSRNSPRQDKKMRLKEMKLRMIKLDNDHWLQRRGKKQYVGFNPQEKWEAKQFFSALDAENTGAISLEDLYQPLLASGIVESRNQVKHIFPKNSEIIEFNEFLELLESGRNEISPVGRLVKEYIFRKPEKQLLPHQLLISTSRRKLMLQAYRGETQASKDKGLKVLKAFSSELPSEKVKSSFKSNLFTGSRTESFRSLTYKYRREDTVSRFPSIRDALRAGSQIL